MRPCILLFVLLFATYLQAQTTFPVNGVHDERHAITAFVHMTMVTEPGKVIDSAILIIQDDQILAAGKDIPIPENAIIMDMGGLYFYPSFIELVGNSGIPDKPKQERNRGPQMDTKDESAVNWNQAVTPEYKAAANYATDTAANRQMRSLGFGAALSHRPDGIMRGSGSLVLLGNERANTSILIIDASTHYSFSKGSSTQDYPSSQMGSIALLRQTWYDAQWYKKGGFKEETNLSLQAINDELSKPAFFHTNDKLELLRLHQMAKEMGMQFIGVGSGNEYQRLAALQETGMELVIPLQFPDVPDINDAWESNHIPLTTLQHWELAPANAAYLSKAGIAFAFTSDGLQQKKDFLTNWRKTIQYGLSEKDALAALTTIPAQMLGADKLIGSLTKGKKANFLICSGPLIDPETILYENWVNGIPYIIQNRSEEEIRGVYTLKMDHATYGLLVRGTYEKPDFSIVKGMDTITGEGKRSGYNVSLLFELDGSIYRLSGVLANQHLSGSGYKDEQVLDWHADFSNVFADKKTEPETDTLVLGNIIYPFQAYGLTDIPEQKNILITNATVWTNTDQGILEHTDVWIENGKIKQIGENLSAPGVQTIDGSGKHLTCGIIDEHSHIAISKGVNEGTQSITSEVRIGDVINSEDVNIYRQLAGGVTTSHLLHGSANAIGGQTALIKLRWGSTPEEMKFAGADGFIKFALGENVKQSNWGDDNRIRFPQTRMGVEQVMEDGFSRALAYQNAMADKNRLIRRDLELDALVEILAAERFITCHSYLQSEINMLMKLAEGYGFTVNTFTHILEGYKVADKMKEHGAGGSTFSDWWAYKYEVIEAIPYNAAIMAQMGIVTAINSDDAEMARRLNQEAAKAMKYGNLSAEEAWKLVTLNPAKLLHIDEQVGSIQPGMDADLVLWSDKPLSIYARVEKTFVDGRLYYDVQQDANIRSAMSADRLRLVKLAIAARKKGVKTTPVIQFQDPEYHCDTLGNFTSEN